MTGDQKDESGLYVFVRLMALLAYGCLIVAVIPQRSSTAELWALEHSEEKISAQRVVEIADDVSCSRCRIELRPLVRLGTKADPGLVTSEASYAIRTSTGYVVSKWGTAELNVYSSDGAYLRRIGRAGGGPGEFRAVTSVLTAPDDSIWIFDRVNSRVSVYSPDFELQRTTQLELPLTQLLLLPEDRVLFSGPVWSPSRIGFPFHLLHADGHTESFGGTDSVVHAGDPRARLSQPVARASGDRFWSAAQWDFEFHRWDLESKTRDLTLRRTSDWYPTGTSRTDAFEQAPDAPLPTVTMLEQDREGLLWVLIAVADPDWQQQLGEPAFEGAEATFTGTWQEYFDTTIEVIDPRAGVVVARTTIPEHAGFAGPGTLSATLEGDGGDLYIQVYEIELSREE